MAKRTIRKHDHEDTIAPGRRRRTAEQNGSTAEPVTATPKTRAPRSRKSAADRGAADALAPNGHQASDAAAASKTTPAELVRVPPDHIAVRAYHLYLERGGRGGDAFQDWITAERQLREQASESRAR